MRCTISRCANSLRFAPGLRLAYWLVVYIGAPLLALFGLAAVLMHGVQRQSADLVAPATP